MVKLKNLKLIRVTNDYTQLKVQMETGIPQSMMPTSENLIILARFYNTSMDFLMDLTDEKKPYPPKNNTN